MPRGWGGAKRQKKEAPSESASSKPATLTFDARLNLLLFRRSLDRRSGLYRRGWRWRSLRRARHSVLEVADTLAQPLHHFGYLASPEQNQHDGQNDQPVKNAK